MFGRSAVLLAKASLVAVALLVAGCGGGGGGGEGGGFSGDAYSLSASALTFNGTQGGGQPTPQVVNLSVNSGTVFVGTTQTGAGFSHAFNITGPTTGQITVTADSPSLPGTYTGTIVVRGCRDAFCAAGDVTGSPKTINVTYVVAGAPRLQVSTQTVSLASNTGATPPPQTVTLQVTGGGSTAWTSSVNYTSGTPNWLTLTPASGTLNPSQDIAFSVATAPSAAEVRTAEVTFSAGALAAVVSVSYTISDPGVTFVAPYVGTAGIGGNAIVRGHGFSALNPSTAVVRFGGTPSAATIVSDTEIRAAYPALAAGSHSVEIADGTTTMTTRAGVRLLAVNPPAFGTVTILRGAGAGAIGNLIYDAERQSLYVMDADNKAIFRHRPVNGWVEEQVTSAVAGSNVRIALSPDGSEVLQTSDGPPRVLRYDPANFTFISGIGAQGLLGTGGSLNMIGFANDGSAIGNASSPTLGVSLYRYDMLSQQFTVLSTQADMTNRAIMASADGDTLVLPSFEPLVPTSGKPVFTYDATAGALTQRPAITVGEEPMSISRDGSRIILVSLNPATGSNAITVYDASFNVLGRLPTGLNGVVLSPNGATAFGYYPSGSRVRKFDLTAPDSAGGFAEIGLGTVVASPGTALTAMTITPDGGTLFLAGNQRVIVLPAP
jgi:hypothetical protein